jgi:butyrate kinase
VYQIFCINPGSTSTRIAIFEDKKAVLKIELKHENEDLEKYVTHAGQLAYRFEVIEKELEKNDIDLSRMSVIIGRGGALRPVAGGAYKITERMLYDCGNDAYSKHPSNFGCQLAKLYSEKYHVPAFIVDPPLMDEFEDVARISGMKGIERKSAFHALNEKEAASCAADQIGKEYEECNFITAHLGSGISITAHKKGACVDNNFGLGGDGPFSPERCGRLPALELAKRAEVLRMSGSEWGKTFGKKSGFTSYLKTNNMLKILADIEAGDGYTREIYFAFIHDVAKEIGAYATIVSGDLDGIVVTGALAKSEKIFNDIARKVSFLAPVFHFPGEYEMEAMANGGIRILKGEQIPKDY